MYICLEEGHVFESPKKTSYESLYGVSDQFSNSTDTEVCPICESWFTEAVECDRCGKWIQSGTLLCEECEENEI